MDILSILNSPIINSIIIAIIIYTSITVSNLGNPMLASILATFPEGLIGLMAIQENKSKQKFIKNIIGANITISIMWISLFFISRKKFKNIHILYAFIIWILLSFLFYLLTKLIDF